MHVWFTSHETKSARSRLFVLYTDFEAQIIIQFWDGARKMCGSITRVLCIVPEAKIKVNPAARERSMLSALYTCMFWLFLTVLTNTYKFRQQVRNNRKLVFTLPNGLEFKTRLSFRHRASCILRKAFHYSPENAFYIFNQQIYFIIWYLLDRASLI